MMSLKKLFVIIFEICLIVANAKAYDKLHRTLRHKRLYHPWFVDPCDSEQCVQVAEIFIRSVNFTIEPCEDFYQFSCGEAIYKTKTDELNNKRLNPQDVHESSITKEYEEILEEFPDFDQEEFESLKVERKIYNVCKNIGTRTSEDFTEYSKLLSRYGAFEIFQQDNEYRLGYAKWQGVDLKYAFLGFGFAFFDIDVIENPLDDRQRMISISPPSDTNATTEILEFLRVKRENRTSKIGGKTLYVYREFNGVKSFMKKLARIIPSEDNNGTIFEDEPSENIGIIEQDFTFFTINEWKEAYDCLNPNGKLTAKIDWLYILNELFSKVYINIRGSEKIILNKRSYFHRLARLLKTTPNEILVDYVQLRFVAKTIGYVEDTFVPTVIPGLRGFAWNSCPPGLLVGASYEYLRRHFPRDNREATIQMFDHVRHYLYTELKNEDKYFQQLNKTQVLYGHPAWMTNQTIINEFYGKFTVSKVNVINQVKMIDTILKKRLSSLRDYEFPVFTNSTFFDFLLPSIKVSRNLRRIVIPAASLSVKKFKLFSSSLPNAVNYGSAGSELAAKMYFEWLRQKSEVKGQIMECVSEQISDSLENDKKRYTVRRATAASYVLGLKAAFWALPDKYSDPIQIPEFGVFTTFRMLFMSFAQALCESDKLRPWEARQFVNFATSNLEEFTEAFQCMSNNTMHRRSICNPWLKLSY